MNTTDLCCHGDCDQGRTCPLRTRDGGETVDFSSEETFDWICVAQSILIASVFAITVICGIAAWSFVAGYVSQRIQ